MRRDHCRFGGPHRLDPNRARLELRRTRLGIGLIDGEEVHSDFVLKVQCHEHQSGPQRAVDPSGSNNASAPGGNPDRIAVQDAEALRVLGRDVQGFSPPKRRRIDPAPVALNRTIGAATFHCIATKGGQQ